MTENLLIIALAFLKLAPLRILFCILRGKDGRHSPVIADVANFTYLIMINIITNTYVL